MLLIFNKYIFLTLLYTGDFKKITKPNQKCNLK